MAFTQEIQVPKVLEGASVAPWQYSVHRSEDGQTLAYTCILPRGNPQTLALEYSTVPDLAIVNGVVEYTDKVYGEVTLLADEPFDISILRLEIRYDSWLFPCEPKITMLY